MCWRRFLAVGVAAVCAVGFGATAAGAYDWSQALAFDVSASTKIDRSWQWSLEEHASPAQVTLYVGQSRQQSFVLSAATAGSADTRWLVGGVLSIKPDPIVLMTSIDGMLYTGPPESYTLTPFAITNCPGGLPQMVVSHVVCTYEVPAPQANTGFVGVTAHGCIAGDCSYDSKSSSPPFDFANATIVEHRQCVTASESVAGRLGSVCASSAPASFTATRTIGPYSSCGNYVVASSSSLTSDGSVVGTAAATASVNVVTHFAEWWYANVTTATYPDLVVLLQQQLAALQARLTSADPPAIATALSTIQTYLARYSTWDSLSSTQKAIFLGLKAKIDSYAAACS
jgi:hypothetical protein